jgi:glutamate-1-semialdehyde 2,1-aminomutase
MQARGHEASRSVQKLAEEAPWMHTTDRARPRIGRAEEQRFVAEHPRSRQLFERAQRSLLAGVPMSWMVRWAGPFPVFVRDAAGAHFTDVDGHRYLDLCLGDTGAMTGHAPETAVGAIVERVRRGVTYMLPTEDAVAVGEELARRFGLPYGRWRSRRPTRTASRSGWPPHHRSAAHPFLQLVLPRTVDETFITLTDGVPARHASVGPPVDPNLTTRVVEFNDAGPAALAPGDVACVLAEPAMTNVGIIHPEPGYHRALREITRRTGTLLIIDETHTICAGPGATRGRTAWPDADARQADVLVPRRLRFTAEVAAGSAPLTSRR